jgi:hypothetical protein
MNARLPIHNNEASVASLARTILASVDRSKITTSVQTEALLLILNTFLNRFQPLDHEKVQETSERNVKELVAKIETAQRERDESSRKAGTNFGFPPKW